MVTLETLYTLFLSHLPNGKCEIKNLLSRPNFYFPVEAHKAGQIYKGGFGDMSPHENFEIFNAKSYILSRVMMFENKWMFLTLFCCL